MNLFKLSYRFFFFIYIKQPGMHVNGAPQMMQPSSMGVVPGPMPVPGPGPGAGPVGPPGNRLHHYMYHLYVPDIDYKRCNCVWFIGLFVICHLFDVENLIDEICKIFKNML